MTTRMGYIASLPFIMTRRHSLRRVVIAGLVVAGLLVYVAGKVQIVRLGYQIEAMEKEKRELERANRSLRIEVSSISSPARIEELAVKKFGMVRPPEENIVVVKRKGNSKYPAPNPK